MRKEKAIIQTITISKKGELRHFQIKVPRDADQIFAIETAVRILSNFNSSERPIAFPSRFYYKVQTLIGEIKLQSCEEANLFYTSEIYEKDINVGFADFSLPTPEPIATTYTAHPWTHGKKSEEENILVDGDTTIISGTFKDRLAEDRDEDITYEVKVILWYNLKTDKP